MEEKAADQLLKDRNEQFYKVEDKKKQRHKQ